MGWNWRHVASIAVGCGVAALLLYLGVGRDLWIRRDGVRVTGRIVRPSCQNHGAVEYAFEVGGEQFKREMGCPNVLCSAASPGDPIEVSYVPGHPSINSCGVKDTKAMWFFTIWSAFGGALVGGFVWRTLKATRR